jgi:hypothetical protein
MAKDKCRAFWQWDEGKRAVHGKADIASGGGVVRNGGHEGWTGLYCMQRRG